MTAKQKKGIGFGITGLSFIAAAIVMIFTDSDLGVLEGVFAVVGAVAMALGIAVEFPED